MNAKLIFFSVMLCTLVNIMYVLLLATLSIHPHQASLKNSGLYRYVTRTNVSFFDPSPNDQRTEHSCA